MRLSATDAAFLYAETASGPMHISSIFVIEGEPSFENVYTHFKDRIHLLPAYQRKVVMVPYSMGHPKWADDLDFDLNRHLFHHRLPEGSSHQDGLDFAVTINEAMLDRSKPLWENHFISGLDGKTLMLNITHHALIDGASGVELMQIIYDLSPNPTPPEPPAEPAPAAARQGPVELYQEALFENIRSLTKINPADWFPNNKEQRDLIRRATTVFSNFITKPAITAPFNSSLVGPKRKVNYLNRSFGEIREVRRAFGGTINDVVLSVVSEGMARYLKNRKQSVENKHMRIMCPVNVRTEDLKGALGNQVSAIFPLLPAWPMAARNRLAAVCTEMGGIKENQDAQAMTLTTEAANGVWPLAMAPTQLVGTDLDPTVWAAQFPLPIMPDLGWRPPNPGINFICTNVPGVQVPLYLAGHKVLETVGLLILSGNVGFSTTVLSYNKKLFINYICEPRLMPDIEVLTQATNDAFDELLAEARDHAEQLSGN